MHTLMLNSRCSVLLEWKPHNHRAVNNINGRYIYPQVLNFIMHWPNLWHFCMFLGFSSSWRGKQRRYLRYSVREIINCE